MIFDAFLGEDIDGGFNFIFAGSVSAVFVKRILEIILIFGLVDQVSVPESLLPFECVGTVPENKRREACFDISIAPTDCGNIYGDTIKVGRTGRSRGFGSYGYGVFFSPPE